MWHASCGRQSCCYLTTVFLCFNLILGTVLFYSSDNKSGWDQSVLTTSRYIRDTLNKGLLSNSIVDPLTNKQILSLSPNAAHSQGYVLPYTVYEQQTSSARNLWGLQFWANTVGMKVVEPFYMEHRLSFESIINGISNPMRFGDIYDVDYWNIQSTKRNCSELVDWENFLSNAPKRVILVLNRGFKPNSRNAQTAGTVKIIDNPDAIVGSRSCDSGNGMEFPNNALTYFKQNGFHFVREVCIMFNSSRPMTVVEYTKHILGHFSPNQVTVIFAFWQGIRSNRVNLKGLTFSNENTVEIGLLPSKTIVQQSKRYLQKLNINSKGSSKYFGVMVRIEKVFRSAVVNKKIGNFGTFVNYMVDCATGLKHVKQFNVHKHWRRTLAIDLGRFGSVTFKKYDGNKEITRGLKRIYNAYFSSIFGNYNWTIEEFEDSFKKYLDIDNPMYIAQIQRTIAAMSDCLVLIGGESTFQNVAISFYKNFHPDIKQQCIVKHCYYGANFNLHAFAQERESLSMTKHIT